MTARVAGRSWGKECRGAGGRAFFNAEAARGCGGQARRQCPHPSPACRRSVTPCRSMYAACMRRVRRLPRHGGQAGMYAAYMRGARRQSRHVYRLFVHGGRCQPRHGGQPRYIHHRLLARGMRRCLALPGKGAASVRVRRCLPCGQRRCRVARRILACRGKKQGFGAFCPSGNSPRRAGERGNGLLPARVGVFPARRQLHVLPMSLSPARNGDTPHLTDETSPLLLQNLPLYPSAANAALYKPRLIAPAFCGEHRARAQAQLSAPAKGYLSTLPATSSPVIPPPQTPQADGPCSWAVRRVCALPPEQKRNEAPMPPTRGAWAREHGANGTGRRHCRPAG